MMTAILEVQRSFVLFFFFYLTSFIRKRPVHDMCTVTHKHTTYMRTHAHTSKSSASCVFSLRSRLDIITRRGPTATKSSSLYLIGGSYRRQVKVVVDLHEGDVEFGNLKNAGRLVSGGIQFLQLQMPLQTLNGV